MIVARNKRTKEIKYFKNALEASTNLSIDTASISLILNKTPIKRKNGFGFRTSAKGWIFNKVNEKI